MKHFAVLASACLLSFSCTETISSMTSDSGKSTNSSSQPEQGSLVEDERASAPSDVTGASLICREIPLVDRSKEAAVRCSVKYGDILLDLSTSFQTHEFAISSGEASMEVLRPENGDHVEFKFEADSPEAVKQEVKAARFSFKGTDRSGKAHDFVNPIMDLAALWLPMKDNPIPATAIPMGSESDNTVPVHICRLYVNDSIVPGKMMLASKHASDDPNLSVCVVHWEGASILSRNPESELTHQSDVLAFEESGKEANVAWRPYTGNKVPSDAIVTGRYGKRPLYSCRGLETGEGTKAAEHQKANNPAGEWTPGVLEEDSNTCVWEMFDARRSKTFEILVKKASN